MTHIDAKDGGRSLAAAGAGIMAARVVFGLTTDTGAVDWVEVVMGTAGLIMVVTGLTRFWHPGRRHTG